MNKNKLIIQSIVQAGLSPAQAAERYSVSRRWIYELLRRYRTGGDAALNAMTRRPRSNPRTTPEDIADRIRELRTALTGQGLDAGVATIAWHLEKEKLTPPSLTTIHRILRAGGLVTDQPHKRPRSSWRRFQAEQPNETCVSGLLEPFGAPESVAFGRTRSSAAVRGRPLFRPLAPSRTEPPCHFGESQPAMPVGGVIVSSPDREEDLYRGPY